MDLRKKGHVYNKKFIEFTKEDQEEIVNIYRNWKSINKDSLYADIKSLCYSATKDEVKKVAFICVHKSNVDSKQKNKKENYK